MTSLSLEHLIEQRTIALLTIKFTSRNDVILQSIAANYAFDFIATLAKNGHATARMFAIEVKAAQENQGGNPTVTLSVDRLFAYKDVAFPLCLITFSMSTDKGYFKWLVEPSYSINGQPRLSLVYKQAIAESGMKNVTIHPQDFTELTNENLEKIIMSINKWYDAREQFSYEFGEQVA